MSTKAAKRKTNSEARGGGARNKAKLSSTPAAKRTIAKTAATGQGKAKQTNRKAKKPNGVVKPAAVTDASLFHHMHALLHTMQTIQEHEEQLCSMTNEIRKSGRISAALRRDLRGLLGQLPAREYQNGIDQIYDELEAA